MRFSLVATYLLWAVLVNSQNTQWASKVLEFSSQYMSSKYSAEQVLGPPNVYPEGGDNKLAWSPKDGDGKAEFVKVGFDKAMPVSQIVVYETNKPGAVSAVYAYDSRGKEFLIQKFKAKSTMRLTRKLEIKIPITNYDVAAIKVELACNKVDGYNQIDAIAISNSHEAVEVKVDVAEDIKFDGPPEKLGENVNSSYTEQSPIISPDGNMIYFNRKRHPGNTGGVNDENEIWFSTQKQDGTWDVAYNIGPPLNNANNNFVCTVTPDDNTLLVANVYNTDGTLGAGVSMTNRTARGWSFPVKQEIDGFYNNSRFVAFCMSSSGKYMLMAVDRNDTKGEMDLYVSFRKGDNSWTEPKNLGGTVNTGVDDFAPFLATDDKTLYFSSYGHPGFGSADIFITRRLDDTWTNWSKPKNIGKAVNTESWDAGYTIAAKGDYAYFNSSKDGSSDLYRIKLPQVLRPDPVVLISGKVFDKKDGKPIEAVVYYEYLKDGKEAGIARSNPLTGEYKIVLPYGYKYGFRAFKLDYVSVNENLDLSEVKEYKKIERDLYLVPLEIGQVVRLNNIFFEFGKSVLKEESYPELDRVVQLMNDNPSISIELSGHTDNVGSDAANLSLSQSRSQAVVEYLISKSIGKDRLVAKGYGETQPVASNDTEEGRELNRRVEFRILKK